MKNKYIPKDQRKKILLICDDIRTHSGIACIAREMVINTAHRYNYVNIAGAIQHPEKGQRFDLSIETNKYADIPDSSIFLYPTDGYGDPDLLRQIIKIEKPDAIFLITDPRYFTWVFAMENELRKTLPIIYLNIWDSLPAPAYNTEFYQSCDLLMCISKGTKFIVKDCLSRETPFKDLDLNEFVNKDIKNRSCPSMVSFVPHGVSEKAFYPLSNEELKSKEFIGFKNQITRNKEYEFILLFNSRNIRRKNIIDTILAWKIFLDGLSEEKRDKCLLLLHTNAVDDNGTDLNAVIEYFCPKGYNVVISEQKLAINYMNYLYNMADGTILLSSNEGWGLALTESILSGTPIIANVTGGMQDQMRFEDENGEWFTPSNKIPSNHKGTFKKHGKWALPVYPTNNSLVGSVPTPYIYDDRCQPEDAAKQIENLYNMSKEERVEKGLSGREWAMSDEASMISPKMGDKIINSVDIMFENWKPREKFVLCKDTDYKKRTLQHSMVY